MSEPIEGYEFGPFRIDVARRQLLRDSLPVTLPLKAFDTLVILVTHHDRVVGKDELLKSVWSDSFVTEDSLTQNISALRRALGDDSSQPRFISTVARRGYRFIAPVAEIRVETVPTAVAAAKPPLHTTSGATESEHAAAPKNTDTKTRWAGPLPWVAAVAAAVLLIAIFVRTPFSTASSSTVGPLHFTQDLPAGTALASGGLISPDSRYLVFVAQDQASGKTRLWLRALDSPQPRPLDGTDGGSRPFWSPDSQSIGFFADSKVKRIGVSAGPPQTVAPTIVARPAGGTWGSNGVMLYADSGSLSSVPSSGGSAAVVLAPDPAAQEVALRAPQFLPDGRHFLYVVGSPNPERAGTYVGSLDSQAKTRVLDASNSAVTYVPPGYLVYVREHALMAQTFDALRPAAAGSARTLAGNVSTNPDISASTGGLLAFGGGMTAERLLWFDRLGQRMGAVSVPTVLHNLTFSLDQKQLLGSSAEFGQSGVWLVDLDRDVSTRLVANGGAAAWSPEGTDIVFTAASAPAAGGIYRRSTAGRGEDQLLLKTSEFTLVNDWSRDGQHIVYVSGNLKTKNDLWLLPWTGERKPVPLLATAANEIQAQVSPDGRWLAYASDESGAWEVYVQAFPTPGARRAISTGGGLQPQWRGDGKELFYLTPDHMMMAVDVGSGATLQAGRPKALFRAPVLGSLSDYRNYYAVTADGRRFLIDSVAADGPQEPITVLVNWTALVR